jgi:hypothetical protein
VLPEGAGRFFRELRGHTALPASDPAYMAERYAWWRLLNRAGVPPALIDETEVTVRALQAYDLLIVPYCPYPPAAVAESIEAYVHAGGSVVLQAPGLPAADPYGNPDPLFPDADIMHNRTAPTEPVWQLNGRAFPRHAGGRRMDPAAPLHRR